MSATALKKSLTKSLDVKAICDELLTCASPEHLKSAMLACLYVASDGGISETEVQRMHAIARMLGFSFKAWQAVLAEFNGGQYVAYSRPAAPRIGAGKDAADLPSDLMSSYLDVPASLSPRMR